MTSLAKAISSPFRHLPPGGVPLTPGDMLAAVQASWATWRQGEQGEQGGQAGHAMLERLGLALRQLTGCEHAFAFGTGRAGMSLTLAAMRSLSPERHVVLLPAFTSYSVPAAVVHAGLRVRLYDLDAGTLAPNPESVAAQLGRDVLCVVVCHLYGYPVRTAGLHALCRDAGAMLLDDAAQALGAHSADGPAGTTGDAGLFSLARGKNITAVDGGLVVTSHPALAERLAAQAPWAVLHADAAESVRASGLDDMRLLARCAALWLFLHPRFYWLPASLPFLGIGASNFVPDFHVQPLRPLQGALALRGLARLQAVNADRTRVAGELAERLRHVPGVRTVAAQPGALPVHLRFPVLPDECGWPGDDAPQAPRLGMVRSYPESLQDLAALAPHLLPGPDCPVARWLAATLVTLPTHHLVKADDMDAMMDALAGGMAGGMADGAACGAAGARMSGAAAQQEGGTP